MMTKVDDQTALIRGGSQSDGRAAQRGTHAKDLPAIVDLARGLHLAHRIAGPVLDGGSPTGNAPGAGRIATGGDGQPQRVMGRSQL